MIHLVYTDNKEKELDKIINGNKTMVIRGAAGRKIPHSRVFEEETLYFMEKGSKKITAKAIVSKVENFVKLIDEQIDEVLLKNQPYLKLSAKQLKRWHKKCLCLIQFNNIEVIEPLEFAHQNNMDDWLIIDKIEDVVVGTCIKYSYEKSRFK